MSVSVSVTVPMTECRAAPPFAATCRDKWKLVRPSCWSRPVPTLRTNAGHSAGHALLAGHALDAYKASAALAGQPLLVHQWRTMFGGKLCWLLALLGATLATASLFDATQSSEAEAAQRRQYRAAAAQLLRRLHEERSFEHLVVYGGGGGARCLFEDVLRALEVQPAMLLEQRSLAHYGRRFSAEAVVVVCAPSLYRPPPELQLARHLVPIERDTDGDDDDGGDGGSGLQPELAETCRRLARHEVFDALLLTAALGSSGTYFTCHALEPRAPREPPYRSESVWTGGPVFEDAFRDMRRRPLLSRPDLLPPRTMLYSDGRGRPQVGGYVAQLLASFAQRRNAELRYQLPSDPKRTVFYGEVQAEVQRGRLDVGAVLSTAQQPARWHELSAPLEVTEYCLMLPLPRDLPTDELFTYIVQPLVLVGLLLLSLLYAFLMTAAPSRPLRAAAWLDLVLHESSVRGLLSQPFVWPPRRGPSGPRVRFVCCLLCFTSLVVNTAYQAHLQSFLAHPPTEAPVRSWADLEAAGLQVAVGAQELGLVEPALLAARPQLFRVFEDFDALLAERAALKTRLAFVVTRSRWAVFEEQQKLFGRPLFYFAGDLCLIRPLLLFVPLRPGLPYRRSFDEHVLRVQEAGLLRHWIGRSFYDMVHFRLTTLDDLSAAADYGSALSMADLLWLWRLYVSCCVVALLVLLLELLYAAAARRIRRQIY